MAATFSGRYAKLPVILQTEKAECGLAVVAMVASYHGFETSLATLRIKHPTSTRGMTLARLADIASSMKLISRPVKLEVSDLSLLKKPAILHWEMNHFVVLKSTSKRSVVIHDPAHGECRLTWKQVNEKFTGVALELTAALDFERRQDEPSIPLRLLTGRVVGLGRSLVQIFSVAVILEILGMIAPQFLQIVLDQVIGAGDQSLLAVAGIGFLVLTVIRSAIATARSWMILWAGVNFSVTWSANIFSRLLQLPQDYFIRRHVGDIVSRFGATGQIQQVLTTRLVEVVIDGCMAVLIAFIMFLYSASLSAFVILSTAIYGSMRFAFAGFLRTRSAEQIASQATLQSTLIESIRATQTIRLINHETRRTSLFINQNADVVNASLRIAKFSISFEFISSIISGSLRVTLLWIGTLLVFGGNFTAGMLLAFIAYADQFTTRVFSLLDYGVQLRMLKLQTDRLADIVLTEPEANRVGIGTSIEFPPTVSFRDVCYRYSQDDPYVLDSCSFEVLPGEFVAIVGESGSGKSTIAKLICGLLEPESGDIFIGGVNARTFGKIAIRSVISSVMQDDVLLTGSILDNISAFDESPQFDRVTSAAKSAEIHDDIMSMPMAYFSLVGDLGSGLSGGQQQRLLLARALYRQPQILLLDEATSSLDLRREAEIARRFGEMGITRIIIAHRPETIRMAQRVLVLSNGKLSLLSEPPGPH